MSSTDSIIIAIDGPAASGKTSVSRDLAKRFGWSWVSTGAFYRGLAYVAVQEKASLDDEGRLLELVRAGLWQVRPSLERTLFFYKGEDVTDQIYVEKVGDAASKISRFPALRQYLLEAQRDCAVGVAGLVAEGRDCGTVVFPAAAVKIYLTAKSESRAERRAREEGHSVEATIVSQKQRDAQDTGRSASPLKVAEGAHVVDTSQMNLSEVVDHVENIVRKELNISK